MTRAYKVLERLLCAILIVALLLGSPLTFPPRLSPPPAGLVHLSAVSTIKVPGARMFVPSPDGRYLAAATDRELQIFDVAAGTLVRALDLALAGLSAEAEMAWSPDGRVLAIGGADEVSQPTPRWQMYNAAPEIVVHVPAISLVDVLSGCVEQRLQDRVGFITYATMQVSITHLAWSPDGHRIASTVRATDARVTDSRKPTSSYVQIWDSGTGKLLRWLPRSYTYGVPPDGEQPLDRASNVSWSGNSTSLAASYPIPPGTDASEIGVWNARTGNLKGIYMAYGTLPPPAQPSTYEVPTAFSWSPSGHMLASGSGPNVSLIDASTGKEISSLPVEVPLSMAWSPDGQRVATYSRKSVQVWEASRGQLLYTVPHAPAAVDESDRPSGALVTWSADGNTLVTLEPLPAGPDVSQPVVQLWDAATGRYLGPLVAGGQAIAWLSKPNLLVTNLKGEAIFWSQMLVPGK